MLYIKDYDEELNIPEIKHGRDVFHRALNLVKNGDTKFHVVKDGRKLYDLYYVKNNEVLPGWKDKSGNRILEVPDYTDYNEADPDMLYLGVFDGISEVCFEEVNEYSVVLANILLKFTDARVVFTDRLIELFIDERKRLKVLQKEDDLSVESKGCMRVVRGYRKNILNLDFSTVDAVSLFYNVFAYQSFTSFPFSQIRYIRLEIAYDEGIGSLLSNYTRCRNAFLKLGWETVLKRGSSRYGEELLNRYFNISVEPENVTELSMAVIDHFYSVAFLHFFQSADGEFDTAVLKQSFIKEMDEYREAVFSGRKMLGVLIRGTDYVVNSMPDKLKQADVHTMIPFIEQWMARYGYEGIFLATEDSDVLNTVREAFPGKVIAVAQERYSVKDFSKGVFISEIDKEKQGDRDGHATLEDTTVNYFYALYLLSHCDGFISSGFCNGDNVVRSFNKGEFSNYFRFGADPDQSQKS